MTLRVFRGCRNSSFVHDQGVSQGDHEFLKLGRPHYAASGQCSIAWISFVETSLDFGIVVNENTIGRAAWRFAESIVILI